MPGASLVSLSLSLRELDSPTPSACFLPFSAPRGGGSVWLGGCVFW